MFLTTYFLTYLDNLAFLYHNVDAKLLLTHEPSLSLALSLYTMKIVRFSSIIVTVVDKVPISCCFSNGGKTEEKKRFLFEYFFYLANSAHRMCDDDDD